MVHQDDKNDVFMHVQAAIRERKSSKFEHKIIRGDGEVIQVLHKIEVMHDASNGGSIIGIVQDITEHKEAEALISFQRNYDSLTGLHNKTSFVEKLEIILNQSGNISSITGIFFVGVDKLTSLTNTLGHVAGDTLIQMIAERIEVLKNDGYFIARYSDDVFSVISPEITHIDEISEMANNIIGLCENIYNINGEEIHSRISVGVSIFPIDNEDVDTLIKGAESAMHRARDAGGNQYQYYSEKLNRQSQERLRLEKDMRKGLGANEFIVYYQPQIDISSGAIIGMEALVRWQHPDKGLVPPFDFIPVAEETGLITRLGSSVLYQACSQTKQWLDEGLGNLRVGVNLSPRQFINHDLVAEVREILATTQLPPYLLDLEITESMAVNNLNEVVNSLVAFKEMGMTASMDDFGTGYSALSMLQKLPLDILKIDRSFIMNIGSGDSGAIAAAIIAMSHSLGLSVIAEGVETVEQLDFIRKHGCQEVQGFYYCPPLPADKFRDYVIKHNQIVFENAI
jgi:diguanylate cyclase (GGDEF)-like protein